MLRFVVIGMVAGILALSGAAATEGGGDTLQAVTLEMKPGSNYVVFDAEVNGRPAVIAVDSGANVSCLSDERAKDVGAPGKGKPTVKLKIGEIVLDQTLVAINFTRTFHGWLKKAEIHVVLGHDFLSKVMMVCDYPNRKVSFLRTDPMKSFDEIKDEAAKKIGEIKDPAALEMAMMHDHMFVAAKVKGRDGDFWFGVDTGAVGNGETAFLTSVGLQEFKTKKDVDVELVVSGREFKVTLTKAPSAADKMSESMRQKEKKLFVGILGYAFFKPHKVIFDYKGSKLLLAR